jgi:predicted metal-dependent HD superfamily phosphohydrolase
MPMQDKEIEKIASQMYDPKMPYHNFGHAVTVTRHAERIIDKCRKEGVPLDEKVVYYALIFHDAGYHEDHVALGFDTKEAYSAELARKALVDHGVDEATIAKVESAILCTHVDAVCESNEDKAVRASDLSGLVADYATFKLNAIRLKDEHELMNGNRVPWDEWKLGVKKNLDLFLREHLELTRDYFDENGESVFHKQTRENLKILLADDSPLP